MSCFLSHYCLHKTFKIVAVTCNPSNTIRFISLQSQHFSLCFTLFKLCFSPRLDSRENHYCHTLVYTLISLTPLLLWHTHLDRDKNEEALKALGITPKARDEIVRQLQPDNYVETLPTDFFNEMWVFGRDMDGTELYIKIAMGRPNDRTICISFHIAEHPINYAFK